MTLEVVTQTETEDRYLPSCGEVMLLEGAPCPVLPLLPRITERVEGKAAHLQGRFAVPGNIHADAASIATLIHFLCKGWLIAAEKGQILFEETHSCRLSARNPETVPKRFAVMITSHLDLGFHGA
jgi:hypothetical protein